MRERKLRTVLLIKAVEESDAHGEVLPLADRAAATRDAIRRAGGRTPGHAPAEAAALPRSLQKLLVERAQLLRARLAPRYPIVDRALHIADSTLGPALILVGCAIAVGAALAALDGARTINILAFPLAGLIAWNLLVYVLLAAGGARRLAGRARRPGLARIYPSIVRSRVRRWLERSARIDMRIAEAIGRFLEEWQAVARPLLVLRARRVLHLAAATAALALVAALYVRGIVLEYTASWESTFLDPAQARALLGVLYGPASTLTGIALPDIEELAALRAPGGTNAAPWIHLIAATAVLVIVLPRLLLALLATLRLAQLRWRPPLPATLVPYAREAFAGTSVAPAAATARVLPYAYEPSPEALDGLGKLLRAALGRELVLETLAPLRYGEEEQSGVAEPPGAGRAGPADYEVLLFTLAATPELEAHGAALGARRDLLSQESAARLLVLVDESRFAARLHGDASFAGRLEERRGLWRRFVAGFGLRAALVDLAAAGSGVPGSAVDEVRAALSPAPLPAGV